jgi:hypothetical protein
MGGGGVTKTPAIPALPVATNAAQTKTPRSTQPVQAPKAQVETPATVSNTSSNTPASQSNGWQTADHGKKGKPQNKPAEGVTLAYIKNVNEKVDARILREILENFGELKYFDVSRQRVCSSFSPSYIDPNETFRTVLLSSSPTLLGIPPLLLAIRFPSGANRSMSKNVDPVQTLMEVLMSTTSAAAALLDVVDVEAFRAKAVDLEARPASPRTLDVVTLSLAVASLAMSLLGVVLSNSLLECIPDTQTGSAISSQGGCSVTSRTAQRSAGFKSLPGAS